MLQEGSVAEAGLFDFSLPASVNTGLPYPRLLPIFFTSRLLQDSNVSSSLRNGSVVTVGKFQSLHRGHRKVLECAFTEAVRLGGLPLVIFTFSNSPSYYFNPKLLNLPVLSVQSRIAKISSILRNAHLQSVSADEGSKKIAPPVIIAFQKFSRQFASMEACSFVEDVLISTLRAKSMVIGSDFCFGKNRTGNAKLLRDLGLSVQVVKKAQASSVGTEGISTTKIKTLIERGEVAQASHLLESPLVFLSRVTRGRGIASLKLNTPTINSRLIERVFVPCYGVYKTRIHLVQNRKIVHTLKAVTNFGVRPSVESSPGSPVFETHVIEELASIDGSRAEIEKMGAEGSLVALELVDFSRPERKFSGLEKLRAQIFQDVDIVTKSWHGEP